MDTVLSVAIGGASGLYLVHKLCRPLFPVRVNCWFCNTNEKVKYEEKNAWTCSTCGQYNGFDQDGHYNRHISEQFSDVPLKPNKRFAKSSANDEVKKENHPLCHTCNLNQELKVHQLKNFEPSSAQNHDQELQEYTDHLESTYRLCRNCEATVRQVLGKQDSWLKPRLLSWKLERNRQSPLSSAQKLNLPTQLSRPARIFVLAIALSVWLVSLSGGSLTVMPIFQNIMPANFRYKDLVTVAVPLVLSAYLQSPFAVLNLKRHQLCVLAWLLLFCHSVASDYGYFSSASNLTSVVFSTISLLATCLVVFYKDKVRAKRKIMAKIEEVDQEEEIEASFLPDHEVAHDQDKCDISTLQIDHADDDLNQSISSSRSAAFRVQKYDAVNKSSINFGTGGAAGKVVIKPARFVYNNKVAKASWVAGGYWLNKGRAAENQFGGGPDKLSRCSSQSSGFGSITGGLLQQQPLGSLPNLRGNSTCGDNFDRSSVLSEPSYLPKNCGGNNFSLRHMNDQLAFYDTSGGGSRNNTVVRSASSMHNGLMSNMTTPRASVLGDDDNNSFDSSLGRLTQEAFAELQPRAESSPILGRESGNQKKSGEGLLEKNITINISLYSLLLLFSITANVGLSVYFVSLYV